MTDHVAYVKGKLVNHSRPVKGNKISFNPGLRIITLSVNFQRLPYLP